jgi:hypothetical protein
MDKTGTEKKRISFNEHMEICPDQVPDWSKTNYPSNGDIIKFSKNNKNRLFRNNMNNIMTEIVKTIISSSNCSGSIRYTIECGDTDISRKLQSKLGELGYDAFVPVDKSGEVSDKNMLIISWGTSEW